MLIIVVVVFAVCWLPVHVYQMDDSVKMGALWPPALIYFCYWFSLANSAINPWLYIGLNGKMNAAFTKLVRCCRTGNHTKEGKSYDHRLDRQNQLFRELHPRYHSVNVTFGSFDLWP